MLGRRGRVFSSHELNSTAHGYTRCSFAELDGFRRQGDGTCLIKTEPRPAASIAKSPDRPACFRLHQLCLSLCSPCFFLSLDTRAHTLASRSRPAMRPSHQRCGSSALASTASVLASTALALLLPFAAAQSSSDFPVRDAPRLPGNAMQSNGISLGFLTQWGSQYEPTDVIRALGKSPAVWGDYWNVWPDEYDFRQADWHLGEMRRVADGDVKAVYAPAVLFHGRMNQWTQEMTDALAEKVRDINEQGVPIWLRFCYEMVRGTAVLSCSGFRLCSR